MLNWKYVLRPAFALAARPGIGLPHHDREAELLVNGAKPTAILNQEMITEELEQALENGSVVHIGDKEFDQRLRIYCQPEDIENAETVARIFERGLSEPENITTGEQELIDDFINQPADVRDISGWLHRAALDVKTRFFGADSIEQQLIKGDLKSSVFNVIGREESLLDEAVERGDLVAVDIRNTQLISVFAHANHVDKGNELYSRSYQNAEGYEALNHNDHHKRIGELLGYTDNDFAWFSGQKYTHPLVHKIMEMTSDFRRWARQELDLMDADTTITGADPPQSGDTQGVSPPGGRL